VEVDSVQPPWAARDLLPHVVLPASSFSAHCGRGGKVTLQLHPQ